MRTVTFKSVMDQVVMLKGFDPSSLDLSSSQALNLAKYIQRWCRQGWEYAFWPEWTLVEARTPVSSVIAWEQAGQTRIGEVQGVYKTEKNAREEYDRLAPWLTATGIDLTNVSSPPATPYVKFRRRPPKFTTEAWREANSAVYEAGYLVYFPATVSSQLAGECYQLEDDGAGSFEWVKQDMPEILADAVVMGAWSECLRQDGKLEEARSWREDAWDEIRRAWKVAFDQQKLGVA